MNSIAWTPTNIDIEKTNLYQFMQIKGISSYAELHKWSANNPSEFWEDVIRRLGILFKTPYSKVADLSGGIEHAKWLIGSNLNIVDSCFNAKPNSTAVIHQKNDGSLSRVSYQYLDQLSNRVANGLIGIGCTPGDRIAIDMVMNLEAVAIYLGIVKSGCVVVSIADSFTPQEIRKRLNISNATLIFTQDVIKRSGKLLPMYEKIKEAGAPKAIVFSSGHEIFNQLRDDDISWSNFLSTTDTFSSYACNPDDYMNILFSSGTTGDPKAIPWTHTTPIKCASDGHFHQDIQSRDVVCWPTNLGWMMGPWLIFATLINNGAIALFDDVPTTAEFGKFVQDAKITMLGVVPSLVKMWRESNCMRNLDWSAIKCFSSTGECSNPDDYTFLMSLANNRPVIEYCGGTEIGGGYITGSLVQPQRPSTFSTPTLGINVAILDENNTPSKNGELFIRSPSIGLSTTLLNKDHHEIYFKDVPLGPNGETLRRHGDQFEQLENGYFRGEGRTDDTMNLGGIKTSSAEIERTLGLLKEIREVAAIDAFPKKGGPSQLVIYAVLTTRKNMDKEDLKKKMQRVIKEKLNPLFRISDVVIVDSLPRTASNKVMRRELRKKYQC